MQYLENNPIHQQNCKDDSSNEINQVSTKILINDKEVTFDTENEKTFISSLDIAEVFEKRHDNVIQIIENLPKDEFKLLNFKETYRDTPIRGLPKIVGKTRKDKCYQITKDGFSLLAMGFTGEKAYKWKILFIEAFNKIEQELRNKISEVIDLKNSISNNLNPLDLKSIENKLNSFIDKFEASQRLQDKIEDLQDEKIELKDQIIALQAEIISKNTKLKVSNPSSKTTLTPTEEKQIIAFLKEGKSIDEISSILNKARTIIKKLSKYTNYTYNNDYIKEIQELGEKR